MLLRGDLLQEALYSLPDPVFICQAKVNDKQTDFAVQFMNEAACRSKDILSEQLLHTDSANNKLLLKAQQQAFKTGRPQWIEISLPSKNSKPAFYRVYVARCGKGTVLFWSNITRERDRRISVAAEAARDDLTGLLGSSYFYSRIEYSLTELRRYGNPFSIAIVDLDNFKKINDQMGHLYGNEVLEKTAGIIKTRVRDSDAVSRFGGDEFTVLLQRAGTKEAVEVLNEIRDNIRHISSPPDLPPVSASAGVYSPDKKTSLNAKQALDRADTALLRAKRNGKNATFVFA